MQHCVGNLMRQVGSITPTLLLGKTYDERHRTCIRPYYSGQNTFQAGSVVGRLNNDNLGFRVRYGNNKIHQKYCAGNCPTGSASPVF